MGRFFFDFEAVRTEPRCSAQVLGLESAPSRLEYLGRLVSVSICPAGIDPRRFVVNDSIKDKVKKLKVTGTRVVLSLDALDASKGIPQRLLALEALLDRKPEWRGRAVLVLCCRDRGRRVDAPLRRAVDALVGHVNGRFGRADYVPVHYVKRRLGEDEVKALYVAADVALIASVREGVNLWAMEYVACASRRPSHTRVASTASVHAQAKQLDRTTRRPACSSTPSSPGVLRRFREGL